MALGTLSRDEIDNIFNQAQAQPTPESVPGATLQASKSEIDAVFTPQKPQSQSKSRRKNRKLNDIEAAREAGRQSLADAQAGRLSAFDNGYSVSGASEWDRIPTLDEPTQEYSRGGYSPNEQRDMVRALMGQAEANERRNAQNISPILGTANREGLLSEQDQKQVDKLNRRINALQNVSTGDVAIDDIAAQNNQQKIAELQNQVDRIYQLNRSSDDQNIDRMLEPGYKASKAERQYANDLFDAYLEQNPKAKELYRTNDAAMSSALALRMSPEEMQEYARMVSLKDKMSPGYAFGQGLTQSMPFIRQLENKSDDIASQLWGYDQDKYGVEAQRQNASTQNKGAELAGNALYQLGQYAAFAPVIESIPGVQNVSQGVGKALSFGNEALAKGIGNVVSGQASDMLLDTLPNAVIPAVMEGRWGDVLPDALKNQGENLAFNALGEFGGAALNLLRGGNIPKLDAPASQADEVADALRQTEELNPVDLARQNASGVDEIAQSQRQAAENLDELSRRVPPTEDDGFKLESDPYDDFDFDDEFDDFAEEVSEKVHWNDDGTATITRQDGSRYMEYPDGHTEELPRLEEPTPAQTPTQNIPEVSQPEAKPRVDLASMTKKQRKEYLKTDSNLTYNKMKRQIISRLKDYDMPDAVAKEFDDVISKQDEFIRRMDEATTEEEMGAIWQDIMTTLRGSLDNIRAAATNSDGSMSNAVFRKRDYGVRDATWKEFSDATRGVTIRVPDDIRADLTDYPTIRDLNNAVFLRKGMPTLTFAKGKGIGADQVFSELDEAMGGQLSSFARSHGYNPDIGQDQINAICEYAKSIKAPAPEEAIDRDVMDLAIETMSNDILANLEKHSRAKSKWIKEHADDFKPVADEIPTLDDAATEVNNADNDVFASTSSDELVRGEDGMMHIPGVEEAPQQASSPIVDDENYIPNIREKGDGKEQISKYRTNTMEKTDIVNDQNAPKEDYAYNTWSEEAQSEEGYRRWANNPNAVRDLVMADNWDAADARYAQDKWQELMAAGDEKSLREAAKLSRKQSYELREGGRLIQSADAIKRDTIGGQYNYAKQTINKAVDKRYGEGTSEAIDNFISQLENRLEREGLLDYDLQMFGDKGRVIDIIQEMAKPGMGAYAPTKTNLGNKQFSKVNKILDDIRGGRIKSLNALTDAIYKQNGGVDISPKNQKIIFDNLQAASQLQEGTREQEVYLAKAAKAALEGVPVSFGKHVRGILYTNMLGNFKTAISRNAVGNLTYNAIEQLRSPIAAGVDRLTSLATGKRTTLGWNKDKFKAYGEGFKKGLSDQVKDIKEGINTGRNGSMGWTNALKENSSTWKEGTDSKVRNGLAKLANNVEFYVSNAMELGDRPFFEANFAQRRTELNQLLEQYGKHGTAGFLGVPEEQVDNVIDMISALHAADSVFQKQGKVSKGLTDLRNGLGEMSQGVIGVDLLSTSASPFTLTPGNMVERAVEYSPLGLVKNAVETGRELAGKQFNQRRFVDELSRTLTGLPILGGAYALAKNGHINGGYSDDPDERSAQQSDGYIEYGLNIGDKTYDTSDLPVLGSFMQAAGAAAENGINADSLMQGIDAVVAGSTMQGLRKAFGADTKYSTTGSIIDSLKDTVKSSGTQLIPALVRQTAQTVDPYKRDLGEYGTNQYYLNLMKNSIPGLRETMPIKYDTEGNKVLQNQGRPIKNKIWENFLAPMAVSEYEPSALNQEANRLKSETDENGGFVPYAKRSDYRDWLTKLEEEGRPAEYSEEDFYNYKVNLGKLNSAAANDVINSDFYKSLDDNDKVSVLTDVYSAMKQVAKNKATGLGTTNKMAKAFMESDMDGLMEKLQAKYNPYGLSADAYQKLVDNGEDLTKYEGYGEALSQYGVEDKEAYRKAYVEGGINQLGQEAEYQSALKETGLSDSESARTMFKSGGIDALNEKVNSNEKAIATGFTTKAGTANYEAYEKAASVLEDDESTLSDYSSFKSDMIEKQYTKAKDYIPELENRNLSETQKGQYAMLMAGDTPDKIQGAGAQSAYDQYGYDGYYYYRLLEYATKDYNGDGKVNKYDRIKRLYEDGYTEGTDYFDLFSNLRY